MTTLLLNCSHETQYISLVPEINTPPSQIGHHRALNVAIYDARADKTIGYRQKKASMLVDNSDHKIELSNTLATVITKQTQDIVMNKGFRVNTKAKHYKLDVKITNLRYNYEASQYQTKNITRAALEVIAHNGSKSFDKTYHGYDVFTPHFFSGSAAINKNINLALTQAFTSMANDDGLWEFLAS